MVSRHERLLGTAAVLAIFAWPVAGLAQSQLGELAGSVTDPSGAVIPGAHVVATNDAAGTKNETVTTSAGDYRFPSIAIGNYTVVVTAPGFANATSTGVRVTINSTASLGVHLRPGADTQNVTVDASGNRVETESSDIGGTISARQIVELPLPVGGGVGALRSPENFVFLVPGTTGPGSSGGNQQTNISGNGVFNGKVGGGQSFGAEILLDGASVTRSENGSAFDESAPSVEALAEFKVTTSTPTAEFGRTTGGIESFATKAGGNLFHGTVFDIFKNDDLDANDWFNAGLKTQCATDVNNPPGSDGYYAYRRRYSNPADKKNDYGGSLGGPVFLPHIYNGRDKSFFFFSYEQYRQTLSATLLSTVPTAAERSGNFSGILGAATKFINPCTGQPILQNQIFDPATTTVVNGSTCRFPFANNVIPQSRFSKTAAALNANLPVPNSPGSPSTYGFFNNYAIGTSYPLLNTTMTLRGDHNFSEKSKIFGSYSSRDNVRSGANNLPAPYTGLQPQDFFTHYARAGWDYSFSPTVLNHFNAGYNRTNSLNYPSTYGATNYSQQAGIGNVVASVFPQVTFDGLDSFTNYGAPNNSDAIDNGSRLNDSVSWQKGRNSFKFGVDLRYQQFSVKNINIPTFGFSRSQTSAPLISSNPTQLSGNSYASYLLGTPGSGNQTAYIHNQRWNSKYFAVFAQDDVKATPNLTLNLGLRYSIDFPRHEAENLTSNFSLTAPDPHASNRPGALVFAQTSPGVNSAWADTYFKDIAPRIGFAYQLPGTQGKSVIRGAGGLLYAPLLYADFGGGEVTGYSVPIPTNSPDGYSPAFQLDSGYPTAFPTAPNLDPGQLDASTSSSPSVFNPVGGSFIAPSFGRPGMISNWSLQFQQEVTRDLVFTIGYLGFSAQNLRSALQNINNIPLSAFAYGDHLSRDNVSAGNPADGVSAPYPGFNGQLQHALRPFPQYDYIATDCCLQNVGHSSYNALVASLNRQFRNGLNLQTAFTWQKNLTDADSALPNVNVPNGLGQDQNVYDHRLEKSISIQNIPVSFVTSYLYELPFGKGRPFFSTGGVKDLLIGGWSIGGVQRYQSGTPVSFLGASGIPGYENLIRYSRGPGSLANPAYTRHKLGANAFSNYG